MTEKKSKFSKPKRIGIGSEELKFTPVGPVETYDGVAKEADGSDREYTGYLLPVEINGEFAELKCPESIGKFLSRFQDNSYVGVFMWAKKVVAERGGVETIWGEV